MPAHSNLAMPLAEVIRPTTVIEPERLGHRLGVKLVLVSETFQLSGSFKFRAAYNLASQVEEEMIITASSGNFGRAPGVPATLAG